MNSAQAEKPVRFPRADGSRIPFEVYGSPDVYGLEQERIFSGPLWSFVAMRPKFRVRMISRALSSAIPPGPNHFFRSNRNSPKPRQPSNDSEYTSAHCCAVVFGAGDVLCTAFFAPC